MNEEESIKSQLGAAGREYQELGGWAAFRSGEWLFMLIRKSFTNYWERANAEYFQQKYGTMDPDALARKLTSVAAKNAALLGGAAGALVSADEITALVTGAEGGVGLPANLAVAATVIGGAAILLMRLQLQLLANLGKIYGVPLDPNDPEDILTIIAFALGGAAAEAAGNAGIKIGGRFAGYGVKQTFKKETLAALKRIAAKAGVRLLKRQLVNATIPVVSIILGGSWNFTATKTMAHVARRHFVGRHKSGGGHH